MGVPYDYESIMHYPWNAFSSNGKDTMSPVRDTKGKTPYIELSAADAKQTSLMYNCAGNICRSTCQKTHNVKVIPFLEYIIL